MNRRSARTPPSSRLINNGGSEVERFNYRNIEGITVNTLRRQRLRRDSTTSFAATTDQPRPGQRPRPGRPGVPLGRVRRFDNGR